MTKRNKKDKVRLKSGVISGALALSMGLSLLPSGGGIEAAQSARDDVIPHSEYIDHRSNKIEYKLPGITSRHLWQLSKKSVIVNGRTLSEPAVVMNEVTYLPLRAFANSLGQAKVSYNKSTRTATLEMNGLYLTSTDGGFVTYANNRPLFSFSPNVLMSNGRMYVPASALTKALGVVITSNTDSTITGQLLASHTRIKILPRG